MVAGAVWYRLSHVGNVGSEPVDLAVHAVDLAVHAVDALPEFPMGLVVVSDDPLQEPDPDREQDADQRTRVGSRSLSLGDRR